MPILKNHTKDPSTAKILVVHGELQHPQDLIQILQTNFNKVTTLSKPQALPHDIPDLLVVDYRVHDMTGILLYRNLILRPELSLTPAIFVSHTTSQDHRLNAYELGAADYLTRPLKSSELLKKCHLHFQQQRRILQDHSVHIGNLSLFPETEEVFVAGNPVSLTKYEYKILSYLLSTPRQIVSRSEIYENVWGPNHTSSGRLDTQLYNLKKKLGGFNGKIKSVNKVGMRVLLSDSTFSQEAARPAPQPLPQVPHL